MSMSKKHFIELADIVRSARGTDTEFSMGQMGKLAAFCADQNPRFNPKRWLDYIEGKCGPSGGAVKPQRKLEEEAE